MTKPITTTRLLIMKLSSPTLLSRIFGVSLELSVLVVAGAGISVAAGIPDFRSSEGLFRTLKDANPNSLLSSGKDLFDSSVFNVREQLFSPEPLSGHP